MSTAWLPTGKLSDGTLVFGPLAERPKDADRVVEVKIDGLTWYVKHSGEKISPLLQGEFEEWARKRVLGYQKR